MSQCIRKPALWGSDQVRHKPACTSTEDGKRLEILDLESREIALSSENKGTDQLHSYCTLIFAYAKCWFSDSAAHKSLVNNDCTDILVYMM